MSLSVSTMMGPTKSSWPAVDGRAGGRAVFGWRWGGRHRDALEREYHDGPHEVKLACGSNT
eukprot:364569-Chlamydomonas_euryale.AAC.22